MTRCATQHAPEKSTANGGASAFPRHSRPAACLPKFVDHPELKGRWAYERLFVETPGPTPHKPATNGDLNRFKRMHFCGRRISTLLGRYGDRAVQRSDYDRFTRLHQQLRDDIASDNLGLVYNLYKQSRIIHVDGDELLSEGMLALSRAIDTFNPWMGFRFSTYACNAIQRAFYRYARKESKRRQKEPVRFESAMEKSRWLDIRHTEESLLYAERLTRILGESEADLTRVEKTVLTQRFPLRLGATRRTLSIIGEKMKLSKERVRQIEKVALVKLRFALECDPVLNPEPSIVLNDPHSEPKENTHV